jgi:GPI mannosyltransferase 3
MIDIEQFSITRRGRGLATMLLAGLLLLGLILRLVITFAFPSINVPDETYQTIEQALRLTTGVGFVPWEFETGIRSWLLPGLFAGLMEIAKLAGSRPENPTAIYIFMDILSLLPVVCGFLWGLRAFGLAGAVVVGFVNASWPDLIYFAPHTLTEVAAGNVFVSALYVAYPDRQEVSSGRLFAAGILFGLTFVLRFHIAPAIAVGVAGVCGLEVRRSWIPMILGALLPLIAGGLLDTLTLGFPLQSIWLNAWVNLYQGKSEEFGVLSWFYLLGVIAILWGGAFAFIIALASLGGRRLPLLLAVTGTIFATSSLIPHKEYRFIYPALPLIATLAGIGSVELLDALWRALRPRTGRFIGALIAASVWGCVSVLLLGSAPFQHLLLRFSGDIAAARALSDTAAVCGIAVYELTPPFWPLGHAYVREGIALYLLGSDKELVAEESKFNAIVTKQSTTVPAPSFTRRTCFANGYGGWWQGVRNNELAEPVCIWLRPETCAEATTDRSSK